VKNLRNLLPSVIVLIISFQYAISFSQTIDLKEGKSLRVVFYNLENYFDPFIDSTISYSQYSPEGDLHWTKGKFNNKTLKLSKVFQALSGWEGIALIGVCELENKYVLNQLLYSTPLKAYSYNYIHYDSKDNRGIDVALIYGSQFVPLMSRVYSIKDDKNKMVPTRDILYVKGLLNMDTVHVFVNHWTSRYRGLMESNALRMSFSELLKSKTDSLLSVNTTAKIIIMGDFNDQPGDKSMINLTRDGNLLNIVPKPLNNNCVGTLKFQNNWYIFDQILLTNSLLDVNENICVSNNRVRIFDESFLLENDEKYLGNKPFRTNLGYKYHGGFSDHLPVFMDLIIK
jgi:hypothetical protein